MEDYGRLLWLQVALRVNEQGLLLTVYELRKSYVFGMCVQLVESESH